MPVIPVNMSFEYQSVAAAFDTQCIAAVSLSILLYDYCLTFTNEVNWIWRAPNKFTFSILLFYLNRYITVLSVPLLIIQYFWQNTDRGRLNACDLVVKFHFYILIFSQVVVAAVLIQRAYALYGKSRLILAGTCAISLVAAVLGIWSVVTSPSMVHTRDQLLEKGTCILPISLPSIERFMPAIIVAIVLEFVAFVLTLIKSIQNIKTGSYLMEVVLADGLIYFCVVMLTHFGVILSFYLPGDFSRGNISTLANCLNSVLITRLILHLRDPSVVSRIQSPSTQREPSQDVFSTVILSDGGSCSTENYTLSSGPEASYDSGFMTSQNNSITHSFKPESHYNRGDSQV